MSLDPNGDDIRSLCKKLADWDRRNEALLEKVSGLPTDDGHTLQWWSVLTEADKLSAEGCELLEALRRKMERAIELLCQRKNCADGLISEIQMIANENSSGHLGKDWIDAGIPEPYPTEKLREFINVWKEQNARIREVRMELSSQMPLKLQKE